MKNKIQGFEWFLPLVYKDSLAQCKFEQGDVIYKNKLDGTNWGEEKLKIEYLIQVKSPTRAINTAKGDLDVFSSNWNTKIIFEKIFPNDATLNETIETTQGSLYHFLWKNNENILFQSDLKPCITSIRPKYINSAFISSKIPKGFSGFAIITDSVSNLLNSKRDEIYKILNENFICKSEIYLFNQAINIIAIKENIDSKFSPTLGVELFIIDSQDSSSIIELIKTKLFKGKKNQFKINTHGLLITN